MTDKFQCLRLLADGQVHTGTTLGSALGISRAAVWKHLQQFESYGININAVRGRGYQLNEPLDLLDEKMIRAFDFRSDDVFELHVLSEIDSTNSFLAIQPKSARFKPQVCLTEYQTMGRGRRGRQWQSPFAQNIYLSVKRRFDCGLMSLAGLSLAVGVATARALKPFVDKNVQLKWPNDVYLDGKKLGGILIELSGEAAGPCEAIIGVGVNVRMNKAETIDQPWTSLIQHCTHLQTRNAIAANLIDELLIACTAFERDGFSIFKSSYEGHDLFLGSEVELISPGSTLMGRYVGVNERGELLLQTSEGLQPVIAGEISLRSRTK